MSYRDEFRSSQREVYWTFPRVLLFILILMAVSYGIGFIATGGDLAIYKFFAPRQEAIRRQVFEQTKSYRQGSIQRLNTLCGQIAEADDDHKPMLNAVVSQEFSEWDANDVPQYLRPCLNRARLR